MKFKYKDGTEEFHWVKQIRGEYPREVQVTRAVPPVPEIDWASPVLVNHLWETLDFKLVAICENEVPRFEYHQI